MRGLPCACFLVGCWIAVGGLAAASPALEIEPNDDFNSRQLLAEGETSVAGGVESIIDRADFSFSGLLQAGGVESWQVPGQTAGEDFVAFIDNEITPSVPDTFLGVFDPNGALLGSDDDSSPAGDGLASGLASTVNGDGSIRLKVTGFGDPAFTGAHSEAGDYELYIVMGTDSFASDVDFFSFRRLPAGRHYVAEIVSGTFDTILAELDETGLIIRSDDDGGAGSLSLLSGTTDSTGELHFAVTGFDDITLIGEHAESGDYTLTVQVFFPVPSLPSWAVLFVISGLLAAIGWGVRKRMSASPKTMPRL